MILDLQYFRFFNLVLLPRLRDDIDEYKKLNYHLYECLFKAIYKPAAFFKGILLPLIEVLIFFVIYLIFSSLERALYTKQQSLVQFCAKFQFLFCMLLQLC